MLLKVDKPLVSVDWLHSNLGNENLIIFDCTIPKVTAKSSLSISDEKEQIKGAVFFDIKNVFSDVVCERDFQIETSSNHQIKDHSLFANCPQAASMSFPRERLTVTVIPFCSNEST